MTKLKNQEELEITSKDKAKAVLGLVDNWLNYQTYIKEINFKYKRYITFCN